MEAESETMSAEEQQELQEDEMDEGEEISQKEDDQDEGSDDMESEEEAGDEDKDESDHEVENPKKLFIGGLHTKTTEEDLKEHFSAYGTVEESIVARDKVVMLKKGKTGGSKGFGFVMMSSAEEAQAVLKDTHMLQGRLVAVTISKPLSAPERKLRISVAHLDKEKTTEESLKEYFSKFGTVTNCIISKEEVDGKMVSRGFGFVTMSLQEEVDTILSENAHGRQVIDGADVEVKPVHLDRNKAKRRQIYVGNLDPEKTTKKDLREYFSKYGPIQELTLPRKVREYLTTQKAYAFVRMCTQQDFDAVLKDHGDEHDHKIHDRVLDVRRAGIVENHEKLRKFYVGELDKEKTTESDLKEHFSSFGTVEECTIVREPSEVEGEEGASKGYAFLLMSTIEETDAILKHATPHVIHDKELIVNRASPHTLHRAMITERITKMNVTNMKGTDISEEDLREYFGAYANILSVELPVHRQTGRKLGFAVIELDNHHDVEKLSIMHEHYIKDHRCVVTKFRRKDEEQKAKLKQKRQERKKLSNARGRGRGFSRGGRWGGRPPQGGRGQPQWGRGRGRGGWTPGGGRGGWNGHDDGYYQGWQSNYGPMRGGFRERGGGGRGRGGGGFGFHDGWGGGGYNGWDDGYVNDGWGGGGGGGGGFGNDWGRGSPRANRRARGGYRGRPY